MTLNKKGDLRLSRVTHDAVGGPGHFRLLYDRATHTIGLNPAGTTTPNAYPASRCGTHGGRLISIWRLFEEFGISLDETVRFIRPEIDDGVLILDLRTAKPVRRRVQSSG